MRYLVVIFCVSCGTEFECLEEWSVGESVVCVADDHWDINPADVEFVLGLFEGEENTEILYTWDSTSVAGAFNGRIRIEYEERNMSRRGHLNTLAHEMIHYYYGDYNHSDPALWISAGQEKSLEYSLSLDIYLHCQSEGS